jgi:mRNA-degrading endonuclease RelE of RelBE toxin-antitoxin system
VPLKIQVTKTPHKYFEKLDKPTQNRIREKLKSIADNPADSRLSYPLENSEKRSARVGKYRILFTIDNDTLTVADIDSRGQVYRNA